MIQKQVCLKYGFEPLQIPYPEGYRGRRSNSENQDAEFHLSSRPRFLYTDEIELAEAYVKKLPYSQQVTYTGAVLHDSDPLLEATTHEAIDKIESTNGMPSSRNISGSGQRNLADRISIVRERGYLGNGSQAIAPAVETEAEA